MKPKLLITGASGFLGSELCRTAVKTWTVAGIYCHHSVVIPNVKMYKADLGDYNQLKTLFSEIQPDAVIHAAALADPNYCQNNPEESERINVAASANIAELCAEYNIPCVFTSTDLVFDGENAPYRETSPVNPISRYGEQKARAETLMQKYNPVTIICRLPLMFGFSYSDSNGFLSQMINKMKDGREVKLFTDEIRTPVSTVEAANGLMLALQHYSKGIILHLGGIERVSRWDFGVLVAEVFNLEHGCLKACKQDEVEMNAPRPKDVSLDSTKFQEIGYAPPNLGDQLVMLRNKLSCTS